MEGGPVLTNSAFTTFRACPRKYRIKYQLGIRAVESSWPARVGSAFHNCMEHGPDYVPDIEDPYDLGMLTAMVSNHRRYYESQPLEVVAAELEFNLPLISEAPIGGKIDKIVRLEDGRLALLEYKTTSRDFTPGSDYWQQIRQDTQISTYVIAARRMGYDVTAILYDVTKRPGMRPYKATPPEKRKFTKEGRLYANQRAEDETPAEYFERVNSDILANPSAYYLRQEIARLDRDLDICLEEMSMQAKAIQGGQFFRNPGACFEPFQCEFLSICSFDDLDTSTPSGFVRSTNVHPELLEV